MNEDFGGTGMASTEEEILDFSSDGVQTEEKLWTVVGSEIETTDKGKRWVVESEDGVTPFPHTERFWLEHQNEDAQKIGRGQAKKFAIALTGSPQIAPSKVVGLKFLATIGEDKSGFVKLSRYKPAPKEAETVL